MDCELCQADIDEPLPARWNGYVVCDDCATAQEVADAYYKGQCKWCYAPATHAAWSPRHGWHDLCCRHHDELARATSAYFINSLTGA